MRLLWSDQAALTSIAQACQDIDPVQMRWALPGRGGSTQATGA